TSISVIDLEGDTVYNNVVTVGTWPNQLVYRNEKLYCVNSGSNNIMVFDVTTWEAETPIALGDGKNPMNMAFYDDRYAFVTCSMSNEVLKIDTQEKTVVTSTTTGTGATGIAISGNKVYVSNTGYVSWDQPYEQGTVTVVNAANGEVLKTINVGTNPQSIAIASDGKLHVCCTGDYGENPGCASVIDPTSDTVVETVEIGGAPGLIATDLVNELSYLSVWGMGCMVYKTTDYTILHDSENMFLGKGGSGILVDTEGYVWVSVWDDDQVVKANASGTILKTYNVGDSPMSLAQRVY
ncbi:MAG: YncE family protein, partial [Candidatus Marinimicrobia bacterium]|nr:YncE family protein [Candidatus Neomarinimicrobiota bacterium]